MNDSDKDNEVPDALPNSLQDSELEQLETCTWKTADERIDVYFIGRKTLHNLRDDPNQAGAAAPQKEVARQREPILYPATDRVDFKKIMLQSIKYAGRSPELALSPIVSLDQLDLNVFTAPWVDTPDSSEDGSQAQDEKEVQEQMKE
ncbi:hypothetical protein JCM3765_006690 [Sporobolomyces pararoseus]